MEKKMMTNTEKELHRVERAYLVDKSGMRRIQVYAYGENASRLVFAGMHHANKSLKSAKKIVRRWLAWRLEKYNEQPTVEWVLISGYWFNVIKNVSVKAGVTE